MKKIFLTIAVAAVAVAAVAQPQAKGTPARLTQTPQGLMSPVWSPDGTAIAATGDNYTGIFVLNLSDNSMRTLTSEAGAGYKMTWTADGKEIVGRTNVVENGRVLHEIKAYAVTGAVRTLKAKHRTNAMPTLKAAGLSQKNSGVYDIMTADPAKAAASIDALNRFADKMVINPALSPNGKKVAFQVVGNGMWVIDADGSNLSYLGEGSHPAWMPNSTEIVYTVVRDNGQNFTGSTLYGLDLATGKRAALAGGENNMIPLTPAVSPDGKKVVFENAANASLYIVNLK